MRRYVLSSIVVLLILAIAAPWLVHAQSALGNFPVQLRGTPGVQNSLKVDNSTTPNRVNVGCEKDQEGGGSQPVNGLRIVGAVTGGGPTVSSVACSGGDTNINLNLGPAAAGVTYLGVNSTRVNGIRIAGGTTGNGVNLLTGGESADTNVNLAIDAKGSGTITVGGTSTGNVTLGGGGGAVAIAPVVSTFTVTLAAKDCLVTSSATAPVITRNAAGDWVWKRTAAAGETVNVGCWLTVPSRSTSSKGIRVDGFSIVKKVTTAALTSSTFNKLATVTYVNNVATAVADYGGVITITMPTATQANPYVTAGTVGTPAFMNTAASAVIWDFTEVLQNTGVWEFSGIVVTLTQALY